jgi:lipopolysaccharide biosynthesis glycosyltransferase
VTATSIPVVLACDDRFAVHTGVTIASLLLNASSSTAYRVIVLHAGLQEINLERLRSLSSLHPRATVDDLNVGEAFAAAPTLPRLPVATWYRLLIHTLLPFDKVIYLDSDIVVTQDLTPLYAIPLGTNFLGAVQSPGARDGRYATNKFTGEVVLFQDYLARLGIAAAIARDFYVNAGLLLLNTKVMREEQIERRFAAVIESTGYFFSVDQDVLNACTGARKVILDLTWNFQTTLLSVRRQPGVKAWLDAHQQFADQLDRYSRETPAVLHFVEHKPWIESEPATKYDYLYWRYLRETPWRVLARRRFLVAALRPPLQLAAFAARVVRRGVRVTKRIAGYPR